MLDLTLVLPPVFVAALHIALERRGAARNRAWLAACRVVGDTSPGPALLGAHAPGEHGEFVPLGSDTSRNRERIHATPTLESAGVTLRTQAGRAIVLLPGLPVRINDFSGARRHVLETTTEGNSVVRRISFEVPALKQFWILGTLGEAPASDTAFRGEMPLELKPLGGRYEVFEKPGERFSSGCGFLMAGLVPLVGVPAAFMEWGQVWFGTMGIGVIALLLELWLMPAAPPTAKP